MTIGRQSGVDKQPARIAAMFDAIARRYDLLNRLLSGGRDRAWRRRAIAALRLTGHETLLDLCAGTADVAIAAGEAGPCGAARVIGIDFAAAMLAIGAEKIRRRGLASRVVLLRGDATHIPLTDASVDAAAMAFGIRNVVEPTRALAELVRVLRPGGRLAILEFAEPQAWGIRNAYLWYFRHVLPRIGRLVSRHAEAYAYLPASVGTFSSPGDFAAALERAGFAGVRADPLTVGIVYLYVAERPWTGAWDGSRRVL